jgi:BASS family bile acid:Na+ symporter
MSSLKHLIAWCSHFVHRHFIWFLIGSYVAAGVWPGPGRWIRDVSFGEIDLFRERTSVTLPMVMLALLLANAGLWVETSGLRQLMHHPLVFVAGLGANLAVPIAYIFGVNQALRLWHDPAEVQSILVGLALVAAMPIAGSSTAWSQIVNGDLTLSLGLVVFSTVLSPLTTPIGLHLVGLLATGDYSEELHNLAASGTGLFLILCVVIPSVLGICGRRAVGGDRIDSARHPLKLFNSLNLLLLNYANASLALPRVLAQPDVDFLALTLAVVAGLCVGAFASGWLVGRLLGVDRAQRSALVFGLGMNNNGTGLVLASLALSDYPRVMLPIILYNLVQHLAAGGVAYLFGRAAGGPEPAPPAEHGVALGGHPPAGAPARGG